LKLRLRSKIVIFTLSILILLLVSAIVFFVVTYNNSNVRKPQLNKADNSYDTVIKVAICSDNAPYSYLTDVTDNTSLSGFDVDFAIILANDLHKNIEFYPMTYSQAIYSLSKDKVDIMMSVDKNVDGKYESILCTSPVTEDSYVLLKKDDIETKDYKNSRMGYISGAYPGFISNNNLSDNSISYTTITSLIDALNCGDIDYAIGHNKQLYCTLYNLELSRNYTTEKYIGDYDICIGVNSNHLTLYNDINELIYQYSSKGLFEQLVEKWFPDYLRDLEYWRTSEGTTFIVFVCALLTVFCFVIIFILIVDDKELRNADILIQKEQIYRKSINAGSTGFFEFNLTKDLITSPIIESINDTREDVTEYINLPKPFRYSELIQYVYDSYLLTNQDDYIQTFNRTKLIADTEAGKQIHECVHQKYSVFGKKIWHKVMVFTSIEENTSDIIGICEMYDVTKDHDEVEFQKNRDSALLGMSRDMDIVSYVDISTGEEKIYHISNLFIGLTGSKKTKKKFSDHMQELADLFVLPEDRKRFIDDTNIINVLNGLDEAESYVIKFRLNIKNEPVFYSAKFIIDANNPQGLIFGFSNIDAETRREAKVKEEMIQSEGIIRTLATEYSSLFYINPNTGAFSAYQLSDMISSSIRSKIGVNSTYDEVYPAFLNSMVYEPDLVYMMEDAKLDNVISKLRYKKSYSKIYRINDADKGIRYHELKFVKFDDEYSYPTGIALAFMDKDEEICNRYISEKMLDEYDGVYIVDLENNHFRALKNFILMDGSGSEQGMYSEKMQLFANGLLPEFKDVWLRISSPRFLQENYLKNDDRREFLYRLDDESKSWMRTIIQVVERDNNTATRAIVTYMCIDSSRAEMLDLSTKAENQKRVLEERQSLLEEARENAEHANAAKSSFLFNMSHDIRTPMNAIQGFTSIAKKNISNPEKVSECLEKIEISGNHLLELINDVLDMARIESGKVFIEESQCNIIDGANAIVTMIKENASKKDIDVDIHFIGIRNEEVFADKLRMNQIFINLLSNAVKYTKNGGNVDFTISQLPTFDDTFGEFEFIIEDNGIGMSEEFVAHIFEEFSREKNTTTSGIQGTGLGMAITKQLIDLMGGTIKIDTKLGFGTKVTVNLKFRTLEESVKKIESENDITFDFGGKRALLVEDNAFNREIAVDILSENGIIVDEAEDGSVAIDRITNHESGYYDFILMDIQMPVMDGYTATLKIRELEDKDKAATPIIAMTANAFEEDKSKALEVGMNGFVSKPINVSYLLKTMHDLV